MPVAMISLGQNRFVVESASELPDMMNAKMLFQDFETTSFNREVEAFQPFHGHRISGIAVTRDDDPRSFFVPVRHNANPGREWKSHPKNLPLENVRPWLRDTLATCENWINHNVLFDAHFAARDGAIFGGRLVDTNTLAKLVQSDRLSYGLKVLRQEWCGWKDHEEDRVSAFLSALKSKDYGDLPIDLAGHYACGDVLSNRELYHEMLRRRPERCAKVWETEILFTPILFDIEEEGMRVDRLRVKMERYKTLQHMIMLEEKLAKLLGYEMNPNSSPQTYDLLVNQLGLPVLKRDDKTGNPSFDKEAMAAYAVHPKVLFDERVKKILNLMATYKKESQFHGLFLQTYDELNVDGVLHPSYNQCVRTGRLSCRKPNAQQLNSRAKELIIPPDGYSIFGGDYSQIEFRLIVHYIVDETAIEAYRQNPRTDFHRWVAELCTIKRKPAKTLNFTMAFGAGKRTTKKRLVTNPDIIAEATETVSALIKAGTLDEANRALAFNEFVEKRADDVYSTYHERLPGIRATSRKAMDTIKMRGNVFNHFGRVRTLPDKAAHKAFNAVIQSSAADVMKERVVALAPRYNSTSRDFGMRLFALVHDSTDSYVPHEAARDPRLHRHFRETMESVSSPFLVPIIIDMGFSDRNWAEAGCEKPITVEGKIVASPIR
jgi:DNA polymerase-1